MKRRVYGRRAVHELLRSRAPISLILVAESDAKPLRELIELADQHGVTVETARTPDLDALTKGGKHQGVVALTGEYPYYDLETLCQKHPESDLIALDELSDPHNLGAIMRSAVAFGYCGLVLPKHRSVSVTPTAVRASAGASEHAAVAKVTNLARALAELRERWHYQIVGLDAEAEVDLSTYGDASGKHVLVIGSEGRGLRRLTRRECDITAHIRMSGPVASLNASVAAAIAMYTLKILQQRS